MARLRMPLLLGLLAAGAACGGEEPVGPTAGDLTISYAGLGGNDGALLLLVTGGPVESVTPVGSYRAESAGVGTNATRVVITGALTAGDVIRIRVPDLDAAANYRVQVEAVAERTTFALLDPGPYTATSRR